MRFLEVAIKLSKTSDHPLKNFAAIAFKGGNIQAMATNRGKTDPTSKSYRKRLHAEEALVKKLKDLSGCSVLVVRVDEGDVLSMAKPCHHCFKLLKEHGAKRIFYSAWDGTIQKV